MSRPLTDTQSFCNKTEEEQAEHIARLQEKRQNLQTRKVKVARPVKLPLIPFESQAHKLCYLGLPKIYQKLFI